MVIRQVGEQAGELSLGLVESEIVVTHLSRFLEVWVYSWIRGQRKNVKGEKC